MGFAHYKAVITLPTKVCLVKAVFFSSHVWIWELDYKESWAPKNWWIWTMALEKALESPLDCKGIQPVHPKGDQSLQYSLQDFPWCWERLKVGGERDNRGRDGWMTSLTRQTLGNWWWTGKSGMLQSMGLQSWTRLSDWTELKTHQSS